MKCEKFEELWNDCLDRRVSPQTNDQLSAHAALCPKCAELMAGGELLQWAFPGMPQAAPSAGFSSRVLDAWNQSAVLESTAIATVVQEVAVSPLAAPQIVESIPVATEVNRKKNNAWKWAAGIAASVALVAILSAKSLVVARPKAVGYDMAAVFHRENISHVGYTVADGITPVTKSVSAALQSLKRPLIKNNGEPQQPGGAGKSSWIDYNEIVNV
jgi:hypothetical protein